MKWANYSAVRSEAATTIFWTRLFGLAAGVISSAMSAASRFGDAIWRLLDSRRFQTMSLALCLFAIVVIAVPIEAIAIPGYLVTWMASLFGAWMLLSDD